MFQTISILHRVLECRVFYQYRVEIISCPGRFEPMKVVQHATPSCLADEEREEGVAQRRENISAMQTKPSMLIVDDDHSHNCELEVAFRNEGFEVKTVSDFGHARAEIRRRPPCAIVMTNELEDGRAIDLLQSQEVIDNDIVCVVCVYDPAIQDVVEAVNGGAVDVIEKPVGPGHLSAILGKALAERKKPKKGASTSNIGNLARPPIVGSSKPLVSLLESLKLVIQAPKATVLIEGESGTGKELIARSIHYDGPRCDEPFLAINCATLTENLLEAELFGYEPGAFTGALSSGKKGLFDAADGGTLFLDEVGELAPGLQARLLRVLQENRIKRVGGVSDIEVDVRIIAATNRDLRAEVTEKRFRADLFYRLNVVPIHVPPLRKRADDIPELCSYFLEKFASEMGKSILGFSPEAHARLARYPWPGNVRELRNVCEYAAIVCDGEAIENRHLTIPKTDSEVSAETDTLQLKDMSLRGMESELIRMVLNETRFNITRSANILGINRSTLYNKMRDYGLQRDDCPKIKQSV
ncbi:MAG: DNA-binding NtrC family response regulator [Planctomycetota bacterium]|jgi:DNA-binding NtrC family response regulator